jgi:PKHD-type hydroxylase
MKQEAETTDKSYTSEICADKFDDLIDTAKFNTRSLSPVRLFDTLTELECDNVCKLGRAHGLAPGQMYIPEQNYRLSMVSVITPTTECEWLVTRAKEIARQANECFALDLDENSLKMQYAEYPEGGLIEWHSDYDSMFPTPRKLSISVQLTAASQYSGGGLEFFPFGELPLSRRIGTAIAFPSFLMHRVSKISHGSRSALVIWFGGPHLK